MCVCVLTGARQVRSPPRVPPPHPHHPFLTAAVRIAGTWGTTRSRWCSETRSSGCARSSTCCWDTTRCRSSTEAPSHSSTRSPCCEYRVCVCVCVCVCVRLLPAQLGCRVCACVCGTVYVCVRAFFHLNWLTVLRVLHVLACMCALTLSRSPCCKYRVSACVRACVCVLPAQHSHRAVSTVRACVCVLYVCAFFQHRVRVCARQFD